MGLIKRFEDSSKLREVYQAFFDKYSSFFSLGVFELRGFNATEDVQLIQSEYFQEKFPEAEYSDYATVYFLFDGKVPFHVLEKTSGELVLVDEVFDDNDTVVDLVEFESTDDLLNYLDVHYAETVPRLAAIADKYYSKYK